MNERNLDIEAKLSALLELSKSTVEGTEHEAALALETAIRMAAKYGISLSSLADKRKSYAGDWFAGAPKSAQADENVHYTDAFVAAVELKRWCDLVESYQWERYRRDYDTKEGMIWMYRQPGREPRIELRIFERPWGEIEFEVVRNPDPIIGTINKWVRNGFDCIALGVTYWDCRTWLDEDKKKPFV